MYCPENHTPLSTIIRDAQTALLPLAHKRCHDNIQAVISQYGKMGLPPTVSSIAFHSGPADQIEHEFLCFLRDNLLTCPHHGAIGAFDISAYLQIAQTKRFGDKLDLSSAAQKGVQKASSISGAFLIDLEAVADRPHRIPDNMLAKSELVDHAKVDYWSTLVLTDKPSEVPNSDGRVYSLTGPDAYFHNTQTALLSSKYLLASLLFDRRSYRIDSTLLQYLEAHAFFDKHEFTGLRCDIAQYDGCHLFVTDEVANLAKSHMKKLLGVAQSRGRPSTKKAAAKEAIRMLIETEGWDNVEKMPVGVRQTRILAHASDQSLSANTCRRAWESIKQEHTVMSRN